MTAHKNSLFPEPDLSSWGVVCPEPKQLQISDAVIELDIWNDEGGLMVGNIDGKHYWSMDGYGSSGWQEIPEYLYRALVQFSQEAEREGA